MTNPNNLKSAFFSRVHKTDSCWLWMGNLKRGYGRFRRKLAHRLSLEIAGVEIPEGMFVCHHCDNPRCVNPSHLFVGTAQDNHRDMVAKQRHAIGEKSGLSKINEASARNINSLHCAGMDYRLLARLFSISKSHTTGVIGGTYWPHLPRLTKSVREDKFFKRFPSVLNTGDSAVKLSSSDVAEIRSLYPLLSQKQIGQRFGVDASTVSFVVNRKGRYA